MARSQRTYRKVEPALWTDGVIRKLSKPKPNAQTLWLFLLTGHRTTVIPGVVVARPAVMADDLGWSLAGWRKCMAEITAAGLAEMDEDTGLVVLNNALMHKGEPRSSAKPSSGNQMKSWVSAYRDLTDCDLKSRLGSTLSTFATQCGAEMLNAFTSATDTPCTGHDARPSDGVTHGVTDAVLHAQGTQDQEQKQEQEQKERAGSAPPPLTLVPVDPIRPTPEASFAVAAVAEINRLTGRGFDPEAKGTVRLCKALIKAGHNVTEALAVIRAKHDEWGGDPKMADRVCPDTLLALANFEKYLDAIKAGPARLAASAPRPGEFQRKWGDE